jgi:hypothetical protein
VANITTPYSVKAYGSTTECFNGSNRGANLSPVHSSTIGKPVVTLILVTERNNSKETLFNTAEKI